MTKRPTLLVLASTYPRWEGDPEPAFVHELAKRLTEYFDVTALCPHAPGAARREILDGVEVIRYRYAPERMETLVNDGGIVANLRKRWWSMLLVPTFVLGQAWSLWQLLRRRSVDLVHAHWLIPQGLVCALLGLGRSRKTPFIVTSHGADLYALRGALADALKRHVVRRASAVTVVSAAMRDELARIGADVREVLVRPMGVDLTGRFVPDDSSRSADEILFVGRLVEKKGVRHLIDALALIRAQRPAAFLTIAGAGPESDALRRQVVECGVADAVHFLGAVPQDRLPALYRRAAVTVAPFVEARSGDQEGLGLVAIEAAGCGCPVLVGDVRATRDLPFTCVNAADADKLSAAILKILINPTDARDLALQQRGACIAELDWDAVARDYAELLQAAKISR